MSFESAVVNHRISEGSYCKDRESSYGPNCIEHVVAVVGDWLLLELRRLYCLRSLVLFLVLNIPLLKRFCGLMDLYDDSCYCC